MEIVLLLYGGIRDLGDFGHQLEFKSSKYVSIIFRIVFLRSGSVTSRIINSLMTGAA